MLLNSNGTNMRVGNPSYIEIYDNALNKKECEILINQFEKSEQTVGLTSLGYLPEFKKCLQLDEPRFSDNSVISTILHPILIKYLDKYIQQYSNLWKYMMPCKYYDSYSFQKYGGVQNQVNLIEDYLSAHNEYEVKVFAYGKTEFLDSNKVFIVTSY